MPGDFKAYPVTVKPIFKEQIWGGKKLKSYISLPDRKKIGEAWFLADQEGNHSIISNGKYAGMPIGGLIKKYPEEVLGEKLIKKYGEKFPLLFKYIDAGDCLSVQVHPDDKTAEKIEKGVGKTEMWYVLEAKKNAEIMVGFRSFLKKNEIKKRGVNGTIAGALKKHKSKKGDCYFVPAGTVHTMGAGNLVFEVQQNSDITYRLYDWDRMNLGVRRELHIDWAVDSIKHSEKAGKCGPKPRPGMREIRINTLVSCDYFTVSEGRVERKIKYWYNENSPAVFTVINGNMRVSAKDSGGYFFKKGDVVFFPRAFSDAVVTFSKGARFLITEIN